MDTIQIHSMTNQMVVNVSFDFIGFRKIALNKINFKKENNIYFISNENYKNHANFYDAIFNLTISKETNKQ